MNHLWIQQSKTKLQAELDGEDTKDWPEPCESCGANYKRTPAGRWFIVHFDHAQGNVGQPPVRVSHKTGMRPAPKEAA